MQFSHKASATDPKFRDLQQIVILLVHVHRSVQNEGRVSLTVQPRWRHIVAYGATLECDALRNVLL